MPVITPGATYRDKQSGWEGVAQKPDVPQAEKSYRLSDGTDVVSVGPAPGDESKWVAMVDDGPVIIDRALLPTPWPRVGLVGIGPKGAPERRYSDPKNLEEVADNG